VELTKLFGDLEGSLEGLGFRRERRGFSPHVTIARVRSGRNRGQLVEEVTESSDELFGEMPVNHIMLKRSELTPRGPIYSTLALSQG
jgi:2'-5' RNA ligase